MIDILLDGGAEVDSPHPFAGSTPLQFAAEMVQRGEGKEKKTLLTPKQIQTNTLSLAYKIGPSRSNQKVLFKGSEPYETKKIWSYFPSYRSRRRRK